MAKCQEQALFRYTWAGRNESFCCLTHAQQIQGVAQATGYYVQLIPLSGDEQSKASCQNESRLTKREPDDDDGDSPAETELSNDELDSDYQLWSNM